MEKKEEKKLQVLLTGEPRDLKKLLKFIKEHKKIDKALQVTVDFVSEIITCIRDKEKKIVSGSPDKIKTIYDTWEFSRDVRSNNPNWLLVNTLN